MRTYRPTIKGNLAGAVVRVASGMDDAAQLTALVRAVRASASRIWSTLLPVLGSCHATV
jgi:hypothetical protein